MRLLITTLLIIISLSYCGQSGYPKLIAIDNDTVCAVSLNQLDSINLSFVKLEECEAINDTISEMYRQAASIIETQDKRHLAMVEKDSLNKAVISLYNDKFTEMDKTIIKQEKKIKGLKLQRNVLVAVASSFIIMLFILK